MHPLFKQLAAAMAASLALLSMAPAAWAESIKIGVIAPLTGAGAPWGQATAQGPKILAAEINAKGGLDVGGKRYTVEVVAYDDQYKAADAVAAYNRLINQDQVRYMIIMTSSATLALRSNIADDKVLALTSSYSAKALDAGNKFLFRLFSPPADYLPSFVRWMRDNKKERRIALINANDEAGWDHSRFSEKLFKDNGFDVVGSELTERSQIEFQPLLTKVLRLKPELIDLGGTSPATAGLIVRQARELGYKGMLVKTGGAGPKDIVASAGKEAAEGTLNLLYADPANKGYQRIAAEYRKSVGQEPNEIIVSFYDATNVLLRAIQKAGDVRDTTKVAAAFASALPMMSVQGEELTLASKAGSGTEQQIMTVNYIGAISNGEPVIVGRVK